MIAWTPDEIAILGQCPTPADACAALPHRSRTAIVDKRRRLRETWHTRRSAGAKRGSVWARPGARLTPVTPADQARVLRLLQALPEAEDGRYDVGAWLDALRQLDWRGEADALERGIRVRFPATDWPLEARGPGSARGRP